MEKKRKKINLKFIVLIISLVIFSSMSIFTFAYFTDSKSYTGNLTFGSLELDVSGGVSGDGVDTTTSKLVFDVTRTSGPAYSTTKKVMPGDTININLTLGLKTGSEPAYYLISITDDNRVFDDAYYFSEDGTNIYVFDGEKTYLQSDPNKVNVASKYCGKITTSAKQTIKIGAKVSESYTEQNSVCNVTCKVFAIQQANLEAKSAKEEMKYHIYNIDKSAYQIVNYLQGQKNQWISTDFTVSNSTKIKTRVQIIDNDDRFILAARVNYNNNNFSLCPAIQENNLYYGIGKGYETAPINSNWQNKPLDFLYSTKELKVSESGTQLLYTSFDSSLTVFENLQIFSGMDGDRPSSHKIYFMKIYDGNTIARNLIPCVRNSDNKPGFYDTITKTFYVNSSSTGDFLWG